MKDGTGAPFSRHGGVAAKVAQGLDWSRTPLGPISQWPRSLLSLVDTMLHSRHPMFLWWGPELIQFYNDAYLPSFGLGKHPAAMGQRGPQCWPEIWSIIGPQIEDVMLRAKASWHEDALVPIERNGRIEEVYWTYGYSPAFDDHGSVGGTLVVCTETTPRVLSARRTDLLRQLNEQLVTCTEQADVLPSAAEVFARFTLDVPLFETTPCERATAKRTRLELVELERAVPGKDWPEPTTHALVATCLKLPAKLTFGLSPRLPLADSYRELFEQVVSALEQASERIEAFRARAMAESERRNLIMQAPIATAIVTGPRHVYQLANPLYQKMVGERDLIGKAYVEAFPEAAGSELERIMDRVYQTGEPYVAEEYLVPLVQNDDGKLEEVYFRFNLEPIRDGRGDVYGVMAVALDITQEVTARRVVEKVALEREKLLTQLEAASHAKDEFLATVSHELRTPLTSILGWARLLNEGGDQTRIKKGLAAIERNAKAQAQLIEDILDVSRIVSGKVRLNMQRLDPESVVQAAVETARPLASAKHQRLTVELEPDLPALTADEDRLQQVVWNLLSNAVKFTPEGGSIVVSARRSEEVVSISVRDSGKGISEKFLPHVFDRFRQDDTSTTKQQAGLGLGLAIVRHLVELHGGSVLAESEGLGRGSKFSVLIPTRAPTPAQQPLAKELFEHAPSGPSTAPRLPGVRVLVVDDQDDARELLATVLEDAGASVIQAGAVQAAMQALSEADVDVVVSDIGMPDEDGYSLITRMRSVLENERRSVPAIAVTAFARAEDRRRALGAGFQEHISKPIDPAVLVDVVARLSRRAAGPPSP